MKPALSLQELQTLPATVDLLTAAHAFGLGRTRAYDMAARGRFPCRVLRIGGTYRVPTLDLHAVLGLTPPTDTSPPPLHAGRSAGHPIADADAPSSCAPAADLPPTKDPGG